MTPHSPSRSAGVWRLFWGCLLLALDLNLNLRFGFSLTLPLLPDLAGWLLLWLGIRELTPLRPSLALLPPFCWVLAACSAAQFFPELEALKPGWLSLLIAMMTLYTYFQLLTDVAALAEAALPDPQCARSLRTARTLIVVSRTALYCYDLLLNLPAAAVLLMVCSLCAQLYLLVVLWRIAKFAP